MFDLEREGGKRSGSRDGMLMIHREGSKKGGREIEDAERLRGEGDERSTRPPSSPRTTTKPFLPLLFRNRSFLLRHYAIVSSIYMPKKLSFAPL